MIVVSDTSPLRYLIVIGEANILPALFGSIHTPAQCLAELQAGGAPVAVKQWCANRPPWLVIADSVPSPEPISHPALHLDAGEREAIMLALKLEAAVLLMDDRDGRAAAAECGLSVVGTLRILAEAAGRGLLDLDDAVRKIRATNFRVDPRLLDWITRQR